MICDKCKKAVYDSELIRCANCRKGFHHNCLNITTAKYMALANDKKKKWKCNICETPTVIQKKKNLMSPSKGVLTKVSKVSTRLNNKVSSPESLDKDKDVSSKAIDIANIVDTPSNGPSKELNISKNASVHLNDTHDSKVSQQDFVTFRRQRQILLSTSDENVERDLLNSLNISCNSLPTPCKCSRSMELEEQIGINEKLQIDLRTANNEIDILSLENYELKQTLENYKRKVQLYKSVGFEEMHKTNKTTPLKYYTPQLHRSGRPNTYRDFGESCLLNIFKEGSLKKSPQENDIEKPNHTPKKVDMATIVSHTEDAVELLNIQQENKRCINNSKNRIAIFGDEKGRGLREVIQKQLGDNFSITSLLKPGATADIVLNSCLDYCKEFSKKDYVIFILGANDKNPILLQSFLYYNSFNLSHTNVIICNNNWNRFLVEKQVNKVFQHLEQQFSHVLFLNTKADYNISDVSFGLSQLSKRMTYNIMRLARDNLVVNLVPKHKTLVDQSTQTTTLSTKSKLSNTFFREQ